MTVKHALGESTEHWDALLICLISAKLDNVTVQEWEKQCAKNELPTLEEFKEFLSLRANLETLELSDKATHKSKRIKSKKSNSFLVQKQSCAMCQEAHRLQQCPKFLESTTQKA